MGLHSLSAQNTPFNRGVNLTGWFHANSAQQIQFSKYTKQDFEQIQSLGCDVIRLPVNLHFMTNGAPDYTLDPLFLNFLDQAADWAEELNLYLILDNHTFDPAADTDPAVGPSTSRRCQRRSTRHTAASPGESCRWPYPSSR